MNAERDPLLQYRDRFPILESTNYLISNSLGAVPASARDRLVDYYETWAARGVRAWEETWWTLSSEMGDLVAPLIGGERDEVVFQPNVTLAHSVIFSAFDFGRGRPKIVTDAMHFPSILYAIDQLRLLGAEVVVIPTDDGVAIDAQRTIEAIDERTAFVNLSHVLFRSSYIQDIDAIASRARKVGALSIVDGYQSVGSIPVDVKGSAIDVYIGGCLKWLCGGPGAAFLWVRPELRPGLTPRITGWMADSRPFAFATNHERREDAWRFLHGTPSIPALYAARAGLEVVNEVGIEAIRAKSRRQTARLLELAQNQGFRCLTPADPERRGGTVAIDVEHGYEVSRALKSREILCDYRPSAGVRLSPHFYNSDSELDDAIAALAEIVAEESWREVAATGSAVT